MYRILFISHERKMGGANFALLELAQNLQNAGHDITVVVLYSGCPIDRELKRAGIKTFPCFFGWWQQPEYWSPILKAGFRVLHWLQWLAVIRISRYVRKQKIQIIHSNSSVVDIGAQVAHKTGCRHVWHFREFGKEDYRLEYMYSRNKVIDYIHDNSNMIIFISDALQNAYADVAGKCPHRMIYDGIVPRSVISSERAPLVFKHSGRNLPYQFLVTGNISPGKNQKLVLEAANILVNEMKVKKEDFCVHFAGAETALEESKAYGKAIREYILENHLENVILHGFVKNMNQLRQQIHAEIIPSVSEAYGRVTLEAMMACNLVIASDSGSNPELVGEPGNGLLFKSNNANDLALKMKFAIENACTQYIERAYEYVYRVHTHEAACKAVEDVYEQVMGND